MFTKKNNKNNNSENENSQSDNSLKGWVTGRIGSIILGSAIAYAIYRWQILPTLLNYFRKDVQQPDPNQTATH